MKPIYETLLELRKSYGLSRITLAKALGVSRNAVNAIFLYDDKLTITYKLAKRYENCHACGA
ncbi:MAG: helix-turn-helix domain-containing protein [Oscillospiraceae bacterium]|jgi:DNA-binding XRE family transcriptional regulator|nr:helix-turn-helix domain-containing protein [Oscillospiraceae bacterium]